MLLRFFLIYLLPLVNIFCSAGLNVCIKPNYYEKMNLIISIKSSNEFLREISQRIKADLEIWQQFDVKIIEENEIIKEKNQITKYEKLNIPFIIFLNSISENKKNGIEWRLYETSLANKIRCEKVFQSNNLNKSIAHIISDQIWIELIGQDPWFSSMIVACKKKKINKRKHYVHIYAFHPTEYINDISKAKSIIEEPTICLSPRWHNNKPVLYYSKHSSYNVRLMAVDLNKRKSIVSNFDGLNLTPTFCDGKIILSITKNGKSRIFKYLFDEKEKKGIFTSLTDKEIHAISPSFITEDKVVICVINKNNKPRIAILDINNCEMEFLTKVNENCVSPTYCKKNNKIFYCKKINDYFQIFSYDMEQKNHIQLTFNDGHKDSCSCSPCGNYIVCTTEDKKTSRIGILNTLNQSFKYLTPINEFWSNPNWSPMYDEIPFYS